MSNLTPEDVDLRLTSIHSMLDEEDTRLWEGLEDEKISRIAGDNANKLFAEQVQGENQGTESRLSTEVIHRSEGDINNITSLNVLAQALSDYRIKTDLEINREKIAREQLGVDIDGRINGLEASFSHREYLIYTLINENKLITDSQVLGLDTRVRKYEQLLANITADSIQITMDNGEINMGAWTILSQAREWDLQTLAKLTDYQIKTTDDLNQALEDLQNRLPIEQDIIDKAITQLSSAPVILALDNKLESSIQDIDNLRNELVEEKSERLSDNIGLTQYVSNQISTNHTETLDILGRETIARVDSIAHETAIRQQQITELEDGMQSLATVEAVESLTTKVENIEGEVTLQAEKVTKLDSYFVGSLDASQDTWFASDADTRATAWSVMSAIATESYARSVDITDLTSKIGDISSEAIASLETKVEQIGDVTFATATAVTQLQTDVNGNTASLLVQGNSINGLKAEYFVKTDVNGLIAGYGLVNDGATSAFGVNANYFYVGSEADGKKPFMVLTEPTTIGGVTYPAGTWIDVALIANATIGTAHIADASITNAKIKELDASKITTGILNANRIRVGATSTFDDGYNPATKARTFIAQPTVPYSIGDIWKNGTSTYICKTQRVAGSFTATEWDKVGDVTSENTAANSKQLGGTDASTINTNITNADTKATNAAVTATAADSKATLAQTTANSANNQVNAWKFTGTTNIDGGNIQSDTVTAAQIAVNELSAISANIGTLTSTDANGSMILSNLFLQIKDGVGQERIFLGVRT